MKEYFLVLLLFLLSNVHNFFKDGGPNNSIAVSLFNMILVAFAFIWMLFRLIQRLHRQPTDPQRKITEYLTREEDHK